MKPIDIAMIQQINDVANIKQSQDSRPAIEQQNISVVVQKNVETKSEAVTSKDDVENQQQKFDAKEKSDKDPIFNNVGIEQRNERIAALADGKNIFYLDMNEVVCDEEGNLKSSLTFDDIHLYGSE